MKNWNLQIENIGGFKEKREFVLKEGINLIVGDNATGKTSIVNALKLLNNIPLKENDEKKNNGDLTYQDFLNTKTKNGIIKLNNEHEDFHLYLTSPVDKITSYLDGNKPLMKSDKKLIIDDPSVVKFTYLDKSNKIMESIEYSGSIDLIKDEIIKLSNINNYELVLSHIKQLNLEYSERKEKEIKKLNDERKEIEIEVKENLQKLEEFQNKISDINFNDRDSEEVIQLNEELKERNNKYNEIRFKKLDPLNQENFKIIAKIDKNNKKLEFLENKRKELDRFLDLKNKISNNEKKLEEYDIKLEDYSNIKNELNLNRKIINQQIQNLLDTLGATTEDLICNHCLSPINIKKINNKLDELNIEKQSILEEIRNKESDIKSLMIKRNKLSNLLIDQKNIPTKLANLNSEINNLNKSISVNKEKNNILEDKIKNNNQRIKEIQKEIDEIQKKIIEKSSQDDSLKEKYTELITKINITKERNNKLNQRRNLLVQKIITLPENYNLLIKRTDVINRRLNEYIEGFYLEFIDQINSELAILIEKLDWSFQEVFIDDDLNININNHEGKPQKFHSLSDFEKKSISILILFIVKMKYFPDYPFFVIDEHLNSADSDRFIVFIPHLYEKVLKTKIKLFIITSLPNEHELELTKNWEKKNFEEITIYYQK